MKLLKKNVMKINHAFHSNIQTRDVATFHKWIV